MKNPHEDDDRAPFPVVTGQGTPTIDYDRTVYRHHYWFTFVPPTRSVAEQPNEGHCESERRERRPMPLHY